MATHTRQMFDDFLHMDQPIISRYTTQLNIGKMYEISFFISQKFRLS